MVVEPGTSHPGYTKHTNAGAADRCDNVVGLIRCQLMPHTEDPRHVAMIDAGPPGRYRQWSVRGACTWPDLRPGQEPLPWTVGFPRVEADDTP